MSNVTVASLDELLAADADSLRSAERETFDRLSGGRPIVLMGAGGLGRRTLAGLRSHGVTPLALADNGAREPGQSIAGVPVLPPAIAAERFGRAAAFVVTIWGAHRPHRLAHSRAQLQSLGCDLVLPFPPLYWKYPETLLPFYLQDLPSRLLDERQAVRRGLDVWEDEASRAEFVSQVRFRLQADFDGLAGPVKHPQYFPDDLFAWTSHEWFVDGGAFDGDTVKEIVAEHGSNFAQVLAIEPDPANFKKLSDAVAAFPAHVRDRIACRQVALASKSDALYVEMTGTPSSVTSTLEAGNRVRVDALPLAALVGDARPTFIKLDIEGAEIDALRGARDFIVRDAPILAVCVYHQQNHLWRIPSMLKEWNPDYALFLRPHKEEGWDLVCYAVPRARLNRGSR